MPETVTSPEQLGPLPVRSIDLAGPGGDVGAMHDRERLCRLALLEETDRAGAVSPPGLGRR